MFFSGMCSIWCAPVPLTSPSWRPLYRNRYFYPHFSLKTRLFINNVTKLHSWAVLLECGDSVVASDMDIPSNLLPVFPLSWSAADLCLVPLPSSPPPPTKIPFIRTCAAASFIKKSGLIHNQYYMFGTFILLKKHNHIKYAIPTYHTIDGLVKRQVWGLKCILNCLS